MRGAIIDYASRTKRVNNRSIPLLNDFVSVEEVNGWDMSYRMRWTAATAVSPISGLLTA